MSKIKRGVSLYSYQEEFYTGEDEPGRLHS